MFSIDYLILHIAIRIGFERQSYTVGEPEVDDDIGDLVYLVKEEERVSEQTFGIVLEDIADSATEEDDYRFSGGVIQFPPDKQRFPLLFSLFRDGIPEGTESFRIQSSGTEDIRFPNFSPPNYTFPETTILIEDDDSK